MEAEAKKNSAKAAELEKQLAELQKNNQMALADKQALLTQLQLSAGIESRGGGADGAITIGSGLAADPKRPGWRTT